MKIVKKKKKLRRVILRLAKGIFAGLFIVVLGSASIDAVDHRDNISESLVGRLILGEAEGPCPPEMSFVESADGDFCIDTYEVSLGGECPNPDPKGAVESKHNIDSPKCSALSVPTAKPWTYLTENQAAMACRKAGKRLPSNREWSLAAAGTPDPIAEWSGNDCHVALNWDEQPGLTGSGPSCESYSGAFDMIGNVWEWVDASVTEGTYEGKVLPGEGFVVSIDGASAMPVETDSSGQELYNNDYFWIKGSKDRVVARGGYWGNKDQAGQYAHYIVSTPIDSGEAIGFRCVMDAKKP